MAKGPAPKGRGGKSPAGRSTSVGNKGRAGGKGAQKGAARIPSKKKTEAEGDVYDLEEEQLTEKQRRAQLEKFAGVDIYEYEQPEHFSDDEEIDEDEAFDDDDFEKFGDIGRSLKKGSKGKRKGGDEERDDDEGEGSEDEEGGVDDSGDGLNGIFDDSDEEEEDDRESGSEPGDDEDDGEDEEQHQQLMAAVRSRQRDDNDGALAVPAAAESEFAVASHGKQLSLSALASSLKGNSAMAAVAKELGKLEAKKAVSVPAAPVVAARANREVGYEETKKVVGSWQATVKENREKAQLQFPLNDPGRMNVTASSMVASFNPRTKFEEEIAALVKKVSRPAWRGFLPAQRAQRHVHRSEG